ncbi:Tryptophan synthase beta chain, partial [hydrothermal vent metagenome]
GLAQVMKLAPTMEKNQSVVLCLSGRGDKDVETIGAHLGETF